MKAPVHAVEAAIPLGLVLCLAASAFAPPSPSEEIRIFAGKSVVIDYPEDVARISTSNPDVVDYVPVSTREILLHAKNTGMATLVVWAKSGQRNFYNITVEHNLEPIRKLIRDSFPGENIAVLAARDSISLNGEVSSAAVAERCAALLAPAAKSVINNLKVKSLPEKQILLRVKFAELNRTASQNLGVNLVSTGALNTPGGTSTGQFGSVRATELSGAIGAQLAGTESRFTITDALNIFAFRPDVNLAAFVKALQQQGMLQILAEPNLVTSNGKEASFLVGGEFPVPILQGGANAGAVTVQFREFGIRLSFKPELTPNGTLRMDVRPEVSTVDMTNAVSLSGFTIPALATRRIESTIELGPGQSFVIGGLIDDRATESFSRMPGLASIPVLGALFKSKVENRTKAELVVMVTPETVEPISASDAALVPAIPKPRFDSMLYPEGLPVGARQGPSAKQAPARTRKEVFATEGTAKKK
jgi:pilus assembly protein CpaC